jgi:hypothetical protein
VCQTVGALQHHKGIRMVDALLSTGDCLERSYVDPKAPSWVALCCSYSVSALLVPFDWV